MTILPPNATQLETGLEAAIAVPALPTAQLLAIWNPATCEERLLPWLAWSLSIDNWDASWPIATRRAVIANAIRVQRKKGTVGAVRRAIASFGAAMALREWWETSPPGDRGTFEVVLSIASQTGGSPSAEFVDAVIEEIERTKPLSRHFTFTLALDAAGAVGLISRGRPVTYSRLNFTA